MTDRIDNGEDGRGMGGGRGKKMFLENGRGEGRGKRNVWLAMGGVRVGERHCLLVLVWRGGGRGEKLCTGCFAKMFKNG